jgi:spore maturation protein CgeB
MRIFCAVRHSRRPEFFYGDLWSRNFYPALRELGHSIVESQTDLLPTSGFMSVADRFTPEEMETRAKATEEILGEVRSALQTGPVDLFLSYFYNSHFDPGGFGELRRLGVPSVNFYCNSMYQFRLVSEIAAKADFSWHAERDARGCYRAVGATPVWVQMGADPTIYRPIDGIVRSGKTCFVGQRYADRDRWAAAVAKAGISLDVYGPGWQRPLEIGHTAPRVRFHLGRRVYSPGSIWSYAQSIRDSIASAGLAPGISRIARRWSYRHRTRSLMSFGGVNAKGAVPFQRIPSVFAKYEVCLNFSNVWADGHPGSRLISHVRLRDFEAPMCRTCYLTGHTDEITECYKVGKEIDTYRSQEELVDKIRFYLAHPAQASQLREAGYRRAVSEHTWRHRFQQLFALVGVIPRLGSV